MRHLPLTIPRVTAWRWVAAISAVVLVIGCAATPNTLDTIRPPVETLYLNHKALDDVRSEILTLGQIHLYSPEDDLGPIHSAARLLHEANLIAYCQWELLSITEYIRHRFREDFYTLRLAGLRSARSQSADILTLLSVYDAFIKDEAILEQVQKGRALVETHIDLYDRLIESLLPLARPAPVELLPGRAV